MQRSSDGGETTITNAWLQSHGSKIAGRSVGSRDIRAASREQATFQTIDHLVLGALGMPRVDDGVYWNHAATGYHMVLVAFTKLQY